MTRGRLERAVPVVLFGAVNKVAIGFSDHSGWAVLAVVRETATGPEFVLRQRVLLCPRALPRQAYHAVAEEGAPEPIIAEVEAVSRTMAGAALELAAKSAGMALSVVAVAMGRTAIPADRQRILKTHTLLHAAEGELYREALSDAGASTGLRVVRFLNKEVRSEAAAALGWQLEQLEAYLMTVGKSVGAPWTKDEKDATAAAMLALAIESSQ